MIAEKKLDTIENVKETQKIRFWVDLVIIPSVMFSIAYKGKVGNVEKVLLYAIAVATIGYNAKNYIKFNKTE